MNIDVVASAAADDDDGGDESTNIDGDVFLALESLQIPTVWRGVVAQW